jgi:hypothetical protein
MAKTFSVIIGAPIAQDMPVSMAVTVDDDVTRERLARWFSDRGMPSTWLQIHEQRGTLDLTDAMGGV